MQRLLQCVGGLLCISCFVGCQTAAVGNISVELKNESARPVTVWITKTGQRDAEWLAPEDLAMSPRTDSINGVVIPPGKTGEMGPMRGRFEADSVPVLRVYSGQMDYDRLLATSVDSPLRVDVTLADGMNRLKVVAGEKLEVVTMPEK